MARGLVEGIVSAGPIMLLYFFIVFIFALMGVDSFMSNDPFRFLNGRTALYSLYTFTVRT